MFNWKLGTVSGIPVNVHWSFWILPLFVMLSAAPGGALTFRLAVLFAVFGCVVLHELGHAMMARLFGIGTRDITLYPIGGVASLDRMPKSPVAEGLIAIAGPAVNVAIIAVLFPLQLLLNFAGDSALGMFLQSMIYVNIVLVVFNMLPVFPMDGGRVLRAILGIFVPHLQATHIAARIGQVLAILMGIAGLFTGGTLLFVAIFAFMAAEAELAMTRRQSVAPFEPVYETWTEEESPRQSTATDSHRHHAGPRRTYVLLDRNGRKIANY